mgnify:FL=1|jgi:beta-hydroxylase|tara:strand:+ start:6672 stop:7394 length:723 start_codon:yes stop_codon:yes gene_type:complete
MEGIEVKGWLINRLVRPVFRKFSKVGDHVYFDNKDFPVTEEIEFHFPIILAELNRVMLRSKELTPFQDISPDQIYISNDDKWKMFFLKAGTVRFDRNCQECPNTMTFLDKHESIVSAYFSILGPNKMLMPHEGPWCGIIRIHLALIVPKQGNGCTLVVDGKPYKWEEGKCVVFDDTYEHIAVNETDHERVVLFLDYMRPLPFWLSWANWLMIRTARYLKYFKVPIARHKEWERTFYKEAE